ncbi:MAG: site-specific integrase [Anaerolineae bacterium]|nr:site-specific integrase [Anaerolineae bacterium]
MSSERNKRALTPAQVEKIMAYWRRSPAHPYQKLIHARNRAMICLGLATGCRAFEVVAMQWRDIGLEEGTAFIRHGKGDKQREVAIVGDFAIEALREWRILQGGDYSYVFTPMDKGRIESDVPVSTDTYLGAVKAVSASIGVNFATHDFRRTLITELLRLGFSIRDVQEQAGHANEATTARYAEAASAEERRRRFKVRWEG